MNEHRETKTIDFPKWVGHYQIGGEGGAAVFLQNKPNLFHRFWMKIFLGWVWEDEQQF